MIDIDRLELNCRLAIESGNKYLPATKIDTASDMIELIARLRQAEKDAARYRWLRDEAINAQVVSPLVFNADECANPMSWVDGEHLDYAVDKAMQCK